MPRQVSRVPPQASASSSGCLSGDIRIPVIRPARLPSGELRLAHKSDPPRGAYHCDDDTPEAAPLGGRFADPDEETARDFDPLSTRELSTHCGLPPRGIAL
mmetsp:Transcript_20391/g.62128  ORF Transcript_20391/g.62128 Transcript_20391/m.62128 type:complete len:101 (-) Transcript_20391:1446-1748(-)|eukprot:scaffold245824_cov33-Tisochrysis_lutea.AAC.4